MSKVDKLNAKIRELDQVLLEEKYFGDKKSEKNRRRAARLIRKYEEKIAELKA